MSNVEKIGWLSCALFIAVWLLILNTILALVSPDAEGVEEVRVAIAQVTIWVTGAYLFFLMLRGVFLAGRSS